MSTDAILRLWGKTKQGSTDPLEFHPALFHMLDIALGMQLGRGLRGARAGGVEGGVEAGGEKNGITL